MKLIILWFALLYSMSLLADSTVIAPSNVTTSRQPYILSKGVYQTRCHWAHANSTNDNNGETNCKGQPVSNALCLSGFTPSYTISTLATTGHNKSSYYDSIQVDPNPVIEPYDANGNYVPFYELKFFRNGSYLDAKTLWHQEDDGFVTISYIITCDPH